MLRVLIIVAVLSPLFSCQRFNSDDQIGSEYTFFSVNQIRTASRLRQSALKNTEAYATLANLIAEVGSRMPGTEGDVRAVAWTKKMFHEAGLKNIHTEPFTVEGWKRVSAQAQIVEPLALNLSIASLGRSVSTPPGGVYGEVVEFKTYEELAAAESRLVEGKIVFISNKMTRTRDGSGYGPAVVARTLGHAEAAKKGAIALLIRSIGTDDTDDPHTGTMQFKDNESTVPAAALGNQSADRLAMTIKNNARVKLHVDIQNENVGAISSFNVVGEIRGSKMPHEIVLVAAHLDSWDLGQGAMDDGLGIATTFAAVKAIAQLPQPPARTIRLVAFGAEEFGLVGAKAYAAAHSEKKEKHVFGMESDFGLGRVWMLRHALNESNVPVLREIWRLVGPMGIGWDSNPYPSLGPDLTPLVATGMGGALLQGNGDRYFDYHHTSNDRLALIEAKDLNYNVAAYSSILYLAANYNGVWKSPALKE